MHPKVISVSSSGSHTYSKQTKLSIHLLHGLGVKGDAHCGETVKHRSRVAADPTQPNLRQVHLIHNELLKELKSKGFDLNPGDLGENILPQDIDLLALPRDTLLKLGNETGIQVKGLHNPCHQIEDFRNGLLAEVVKDMGDGETEKKVGIMGIVLKSGTVQAGDEIQIELPQKPHHKLERV
ncbi:MOSC domain-containing protein [Opitutia bacterium ISCC 51]|nr:MOSC domain-containing protein [Opitutae bacterium ISCC 51]QXD26734.1 MOSC domain-containing protein [Opitutae bacterium ISCC 52]